MRRITRHRVSDLNVVADFHLYCGRNPTKYPRLQNAGVGNPHYMQTEADRDRVCDSYAADVEDQDHAHHRVFSDIAELLRHGKSVALYCHCPPGSRCHIDTIKKHVELLVDV